jgi:hypothetical protein
MDAGAGGVDVTGAAGDDGTGAAGAASGGATGRNLDAIDRRWRPSLLGCAGFCVATPVARDRTDSASASLRASSRPVAPDDPWAAGFRVRSHCPSSHRTRES